MILTLIKDDNNLDGIDIAIKLRITIDKAYELLAELINDNKIIKHYSGVRTYFTLT